MNMSVRHEPNRISDPSGQRVTEAGGVAAVAQRKGECVTVTIALNVPSGDTLQSTPNLPAVARQREIENRGFLPLPSAAADRHDLFGIVQIHAFDTDRCPENLGHERAAPVVRTHGTK
jgi:hypothetical protein